MERGCRNCMWLYHMVTYNPTAPCSECLDHSKWRTTKPTNADRIRVMTDEELAEYLDAVCKSAYDEGYTKENGEPLMSPYPSTASEWLDWLKEECANG